MLARGRTRACTHTHAILHFKKPCFQHYYPILAGKETEAARC